LKNDGVVGATDSKARFDDLWSGSFAKIFVFDFLVIFWLDVVVYPCHNIEDERYFTGLEFGDFCRHNNDMLFFILQKMKCSIFLCGD
jgi:hypothetical protein